MGSKPQPVFEAVGGPFSDEDAQVIGPVMLRLAEENGEVTKETVLDEARGKGSPLHKHFTWDDTEAAKRYRFGQAGLLIRSIKVIVEVSGGETVKTRLLVSVKNQEGERVYQPVTTIVADDDLCHQVIEEAHDELRSWQDKYTSYRKMFRQFREEFKEVFEAIKRL